ncbi:MAG: ParB/RepB/Spo0J family partition protein [Lachnospiraceae bacterium]|nr:ParB/RepB/Spo0J family partition protein [Lachnospiraceae bacterium]
MAAKSNALGKGLDVLIQDKVNKGKAPAQRKGSSKEDKDVFELDINEVEPNPDQPRQVFDEDKLLELADSIKKNGIIDPLIVVQRKNYYMIVAGERRWRASKKAGLKKVPVIVRDFTEQEIAEISLIENLQRENLNPIEEAEAYQKLITLNNWKQDELAEKISKSRTAVTNSLRLLKLDKRVRQMIVDEMLTTGHARALLAIEDGEKQYDTAQKIFDEKLNVRDTEKLVKKLCDKKVEEKKKEHPGPDAGMEAVYAQAEEKMKNLLGTKVSIHKKNEESGRIEIEYYSPAELTRIVELIYTVK